MVLGVITADKLRQDGNVLRSLANGLNANCSCLFWVLILLCTDSDSADTVCTALKSCVTLRFNIQREPDGQAKTIFGGHVAFYAMF